MFSVEDREAVRNCLIETARHDSRLIAAAAVGSSAGEGDRWSDLDLTFGVAEHVPINLVLEEWTQFVVTRFDAVALFDLPHLSTIYRVFLLPGALQVDLSFTPAAEFGALGPQFHLLFGEAVKRAWKPQPSAESVFGIGVHHAVRAHICIERRRLWQAEYWIHGVRDQALTLACHWLGLKTREGRGFDDLPPEVRQAYVCTLVARLDVEELRRALEAVIERLLREAADIPDLAARVRPMLAELVSAV